MSLIIDTILAAFLVATITYFLSGIMLEAIRLRHLRAPLNYILATILLELMFFQTLIVNCFRGTARLAINHGVFEDDMFSAVWKVGITIMAVAAGVAFVRR